MMVATNVPKLGQLRPVCYSRTRLYIAATTLDRGNVIAAGCLLHEAASHYVASLCEAHGVKPVLSIRRTIKLLLKAKGIDEGVQEWLTEILDMGVKCQRCKRVKATLIRTGISFLHIILDGSPELELPTRGGQL